MHQSPRREISEHLIGLRVRAKVVYIKGEVGSPFPVIFAKPALC
jgi:hypothetical protein